MVLVEIFVPRADREGKPFRHEQFARMQQELTDRFGGVTAFLRSSAQGLWVNALGQVEQDAMAIFEVVAEDLDRDWWRGYRNELENRFRQEQLLIRATPIERI